MAALFLLAAARPTAAQPGLPAVVAKELKAIAAQCSEAGGKPTTDRAVSRVDLTGDGRDDYVLFVGGVDCNGGASIYGDREKMVTVYVADAAGGAASAFTGAVFDIKIEGKPPAARLWLGVSGGQCGKPPARDFASENFCDRAVAWNATKRTFVFAPVSTVRMIQ